MLFSALGVLHLVWQADNFPYLSILLASTFSLYGFVRKRIPLDPLLASTVESMLQVFVAALIFTWFALKPEQAVQTSVFSSTLYLLIIGGVGTALPLLWFANAVKRLPLIMIGFFQFLGPTIQFFLAVFFYNENLSGARMQSFICIWAGLLLYIGELFYLAKKDRKHP